MEFKYSTLDYEEEKCSYMMAGQGMIPDVWKKK